MCLVCLKQNKIIGKACRNLGGKCIAVEFENLQYVSQEKKFDDI